MMQTLDLPPKKRPRQARSQFTFDAIVEAATRVLVARGYAGTTTNHIAEAAGVAIASLYEYFPNKDAIVAQVAEQLRDRVVASLKSRLPEVFAAAPDAAATLWIRVIYQTMAREKAIVGVLYYQVPFTNQLKQVQEIMPVLMGFSDAMREGSGVKLKDAPAELFLMINLVSSTILQLVLDPPQQVSVERVLDALALRLREWLL